MKTYSSALTNYRAAGKAHWPINFISFQVRALGDPGTLTWCHFCSAEDNMTVNVIDPDTGAWDGRTFAGGGHIVAMGDLVRSEGAVIRSHNFVLSGVSESVLDMVHGYNCRQAPFQWFVGEVDQDTGLLIDAPVCEFVGFVNTIEITDGALSVDGGEPAESTIQVAVDSLAAALTARNFDMRSLDVSQSRSGDKFFQYADSAHHWTVRWGKEKMREKDKTGDRKGNRGGKGGTVGGTGRTRPDR